jgi:hypothetical protein
MKKRGIVIYFGEEIDSSRIKIHEGDLLINGRPLIPYSTPVDEELEFALDLKTKSLIKESLKLLDPAAPFKDNAERVVTYLEEKGLTVQRGALGDVLLDTGEGWGVCVLFNEEARIAVNTAEEEVEIESPRLEGLTIVDEGGLLLIPGEEADEILKRLEEIYHSENDLPTKIKKIQDLLEIPEKSAKKLLMSHI